MLDDGLTQWHATEQQHLCAVRCLCGDRQLQRVTLAEDAQFTVDQRLAGRLDCTGKHVQHGVAIGRQFLCHLRAGLQYPVLVDDGGMGVDACRDTQCLARDDTHTRQAVVTDCLRNAAGGHLLVTRLRHLQACRQVHPDLETVHATALCHDARRGHLRVHHTPPRRHPLHITGLQATRMTGRVTVFELAVKHVGHRLKAAVRVIRGANPLARPIVHRAHLIDQQDRIEVAQPRRWQGPTDLEAATLGLVSCRNHLCNGSVHASPPRNSFIT